MLGQSACNFRNAALPPNLPNRSDGFPLQAVSFLGNDGMSWIYVHGRIRPQEEGLDPTDVLRQAVELLPASTDVTVSVPHTSLSPRGLWRCVDVAMLCIGIRVPLDLGKRPRLLSALGLRTCGIANDWVTAGSAWVCPFPVFLGLTSLGALH